MSRPSLNFNKFYIIQKAIILERYVCFLCYNPSRLRF